MLLKFVYHSLEIGFGCHLEKHFSHYLKSFSLFNVYNLTFVWDQKVH